MSKPNGNLKSIFLALGANAAIAIAKFLAALKTGSGSMMAESIHSASDSINQVLLLIGLKKAKTPPDETYPLGYGKEIYFYSFIVSILIFGVGGLFSLYEGFHKLHSTEPIQHAYIAMGVLIFAIIAEGIAFFGCLKQVNISRGSTSFREWLKDTRETELVVILGEDFAALLGLIFALIAVGLSHITDNPIYDAIGSIGIGILLIIVSFFLAKEIKNLLIGRGVSKAVRENYIRTMKNSEGVEEVLKMASMYMGGDVLVSFKVRMNSNLTIEQAVDYINSSEKNLKKVYPEITWLFVEPDIGD